MTEQYKDRTGLYMLAIVSVVAIVGMVVMFFPRSSSPAYVPLGLESGMEADDMAGEAYRYYYRAQPYYAQRYALEPTTAPTKTLTCVPQNATSCLNAHTLQLSIRYPNCTTQTQYMNCSNCTPTQYGYAACY